MISPVRRRPVADWMEDRQIDVAQLVRNSGIDQPVVEAIIHQRYTPSPEQRDRVSATLGVGRDQVVWGHFHCVESHLHAPD